MYICIYVYMYMCIYVYISAVIRQNTVSHMLVICEKRHKSVLVKPSTVKIFFDVIF